MHSDLWQGYCGYWQNRFIRETLIPLGHAAWQGFITQGRGMVVCDVVMPMTRSVNTNPLYDPWPTPIPGSGGFDLDAVGVINARAVPEASTVLGLMLFSLSGLCVRGAQRRARP